MSESSWGQAVAEVFSSRHVRCTQTTCTYRAQIWFLDSLTEDHRCCRMLQSGRPEQRLAAKMRALTRDSIAARARHGSEVPLRAPPPVVVNPGFGVKAATSVGCDPTFAVFRCYPALRNSIVNLLSEESQELNTFSPHAAAGR